MFPYIYIYIIYISIYHLVLSLNLFTLSYDFDVSFFFEIALISLLVYLFAVRITYNPYITNRYHTLNYWEIKSYKYILRLLQRQRYILTNMSTWTINN